jgi:hypothetical protein
MAEMFNRNLSDDAMGFWLAELAPHYGPHLFEAMREAMRGKWMPSVDDVVERKTYHFKVWRKQEREREEAERLALEQPQESPEAIAETDKQAAAFFAKMREKLGLGPDWNPVGSGNTAEGTD